MTKPRCKITRCDSVPCLDLDPLAFEADWLLELELEIESQRFDRELEEAFEAEF